MIKGRLQSQFIITQIVSSSFSREGIRPRGLGSADPPVDLIQLREFRSQLFNIGEAAR